MMVQLMKLILGAFAERCSIDQCSNVVDLADYLLAVVVVVVGSVSVGFPNLVDYRHVDSGLVWIHYLSDLKLLFHSKHFKHLN